MRKEYVRKDELAKEVTRPELLKNQAYYRQKGKRFTENQSGVMMLVKPGPPEMWVASMLNIHRIDKAHTVMLIEENLIPREEGINLLLALREMEKQGAAEKRVEVGGGIYSGETYLIQKLGEDVGGLMHLGRSTGDLTGGSVRMGIRSALLDIVEESMKYREILVGLAEKNIETPIPTYTSLQEAEVTSLAHYLLDFLYKGAHACDKIKDTYKEVNLSPMGAAIGTGSPFPLNRERVAELLGFDGVITNTHGAISNENKTFIVECFGSVVLLLTSVEKLCSFISLWHTNEFAMVQIADRFCASSSIMPQKRNPLVFYYVGERIHNVYALFVRYLLDETALMSWPRGGSISSALEDAKSALVAATAGLSTVRLKKDKINEHLMTHWTCAVDLTAALVREANLSWRTAHQIVSILVRHAEERGTPAKDLNNKMIEEASMEHMGKRLSLSEDAIKKTLNPLERLKARTLTGGPAPQNVKRQIQEIKQGLEVDKAFVQTSRKKLEDADEKLESVIDKLLI